MNYTNNNKYYNQDEIQSHINEYLNEHAIYLKDNLGKYSDINELHNMIFNTDYFLIGYYQCEQWLKDKAFECIGIVQDYEKDQFGEVSTDLSNSENVVNMYAYIVGEELLYSMEDDLKEQELIN
jgi:hypothetical protein|tara:strand:- start:823 stop:1194 length:372 start_codon:yes stop_codon:yes gene_type:complete